MKTKTKHKNKKVSPFEDYTTDSNFHFLLPLHLQAILKTSFQELIREFPKDKNTRWRKMDEIIQDIKTKNPEFFRFDKELRL